MAEQEAAQAAEEEARAASAAAKADAVAKAEAERASKASSGAPDGDPFEDDEPEPPPPPPPPPPEKQPTPADGGYVDLETLKSSPPDYVDPSRKEDYLSDADFEAAFKCSRADFKARDRGAPSASLCRSPPPPSRGQSHSPAGGGTEPPPLAPSPRRRSRAGSSRTSRRRAASSEPAAGADTHRARLDFEGVFLATIVRPPSMSCARDLVPPRRRGLCIAAQGLRCVKRTVCHAARRGPLTERSLASFELK